jgi:hypothetical protein
MERYADFCIGMTVEARYQGHGAWQDAKVTEVNPDLTLNLVYHDGEVATGVSPNSVRKLREGMSVQYLKFEEFFNRCVSKHLFPSRCAKACVLRR